MHEQIAEELLYPLWRCVSSDFKERYRSDAWGIFENFVRSAACVETLPEFLEAFKKLMPIDWQHQYEKSILNFLRAGHDYTALQLLRSQTSYLVLLVRELNTQRKENLNAE